ncbi:lachesin isoform X2 [Hyalella azteca]|uniref:Lachesin isoform X2 n=1 Tax=Hyalella azteca TaxID=294128 RepID=A0A979FHM4_HYAAZ|nr:lachesin isoform X2 [Hyalella azteca]
MQRRGSPNLFLLLWLLSSTAFGTDAKGVTSASPNDYTSSAPGTPRFGEPVANFTAAVGKTARLSCKVLNSTKFKVAWFHMDRKMLLTIHETVVTRIPRFSVTQDGDDVWTLHITSVNKDDRGQYMCQVNTEPIISQIGYLDVVVPPEILDSSSSTSSVVVQENGNATLSCHATGNPPPHISWVREDQKHITIDKRKKVTRYEGTSLHLRSVTRSDMGAYLCIASNGVPPTVSKRTELSVQFSPTVVVPNQLMSAPLGTSVTLRCRTEAFPKAVTYWRYQGNMIMSNEKYSLTEEQEHYRTTVMLTVNHLTPDDFGQYKCSSRNSFGETADTVQLHELKVQVTEPQREEYIKGTDSREYGVNDVEVYSPRKEESYGEPLPPTDYDSGSVSGGYGGVLGNRDSHPPRNQQGSPGNYGSRGSDGSRSPQNIYSLFGMSAGTCFRSYGVMTALALAPTLLLWPRVLVALYTLDAHR